MSCLLLKLHFLRWMESVARTWNVYLVFSSHVYGTHVLLDGQSILLISSHPGGRIACFSLQLTLPYLSRVRALWDDTAKCNNGAVSAHSQGVVATVARLVFMLWDEMVAKARPCPAATLRCGRSDGMAEHYNTWRSGVWLSVGAVSPGWRGQKAEGGGESTAPYIPQRRRGPTPQHVVFWRGWAARAELAERCITAVLADHAASQCVWMSGGPVVQCRRTGEVRV